MELQGREVGLGKQTKQKQTNKKKLSRGEICVANGASLGSYFFVKKRGYGDFKFLLYLLHPYWLHSQGNNKTQLN